MELEKTGIHTTREKGKGQLQITFDEDYNLPDNRPDFAQLILKRGEVQSEEVKVTRGHVSIRGSLHYYVLYRSEQAESKVSAVEGNLPFHENLAVDEAEEFDPAQVDCLLEDISVRMINQRKINIRAMIEVKVSVNEIYDEQLPLVPEREEIQTLSEEVDCLQLVLQKKDVCRMREETLLPANKPNVRDVLWKQVQMQSLDTRLETDQILVKGEAVLFLLYIDIGEENHLIWFETRIPYQGRIECLGCQPQMIGQIQIRVKNADMEIRDDSDGEHRLIGIDVSMEADIALYDEQRVRMLRDIYALDCVLLPETTEVCLRQLGIRNQAKCRVTEDIVLEAEQPEILQICSSFGSVYPEQSSFVEGGLQVQGLLHVQILYMTKEDSVPLAAAESDIPFEYLIEVPKIPRNAVYELQEELEVLSVVIQGSRNLEIQAVIGFHALVLDEQKRNCICELKEQPLDMEKMQCAPGMTILRLRDGMGLWDVAKEYFTTVDHIRQMNELQGEPEPGAKILLIRQTK